MKLKELNEVISGVTSQSFNMGYNKQQDRNKNPYTNAKNIIKNIVDDSEGKTFKELLKKFKNIDLTRLTDLQKDGFWKEVEKIKTNWGKPSSTRLLDLVA